jgi:Zinc carboxypeptidase
VLFALALVTSALLPATAAAAPPPEALWQAWPSRRFVTTPAPCLRHAELVDRLNALVERHRDRVTLEEVGRSVEGRAIDLLTLGHGPRRIMLWSQMHGDEPSATPALLDVADTLLSGDPEWEVVLDKLTLLMVPMLNPDGAERYVRRNAQAIDVNRDALALSTPEGRLLKALRDRFTPELGFNLHDQNRRTTVGDTSVLATIALLAVAGDAQGTLTPGRERAKRVCAAVARTLAPFVPGGIARYDEDWNPRAFGDNLTRWGTPVVLIENGGAPPGLGLTDLTRLDYVALLSVLHGLASDDLANEDPAGYENLKRNSDGSWVDTLVAGGRVWQPPALEPYRADVGFDVLDDDPAVAACPDPGPVGRSRVQEVGDGRFLGAGRRVDATGLLVVPAFAASVRGLAARDWMTADALETIARLGVGRLRWHVAALERAEAVATAARLSAPGRPTIEIVDAGTPPCFLEIARPPAVAARPGLDAALDALTGGAWRARAVGRSLAALLGELVGLGVGTGTPPLLAPDAHASLLLLRPRTEGALEARELDLEAVIVDGRAPSGAR